MFQGNSAVTTCRKENQEMVQRIWIRRDGERQKSGRKVDERSRNQLVAVSEYDQHVLQRNSTQTSLSIPGPFLRRLVPLQVGAPRRFLKICVQGSGKVPGNPEFEVRPRCLIKLNEFLDLLDRCNYLACNVAAL